MLALPLSLLVLSAAPDAGSLSLLPAPLGRIGDVVTPPLEGGIPGGETIVEGLLPGCEQPQAIHVTRFLKGAAGAGQKVQGWLKENGLSLSPKEGVNGRLPPVLDAYDRALKSATAYKACEPDPAWQTRDARTERLKCVPKRKSSPPLPSRFLFAKAGEDPKVPTAVVQLSPGSKEKPCRPRLSATMFDSLGQARFRYHADYGGDLSVEALGDGCSVAFFFDPTTQAFRPRVKGMERCAPARKNPAAPAPPRP